MSDKTEIDWDKMDWEDWDLTNKHHKEDPSDLWNQLVRSMAILLLTFTKDSTLALMYPEFLFAKTLIRYHLKPSDIARLLKEAVISIHESQGLLIGSVEVLTVQEAILQEYEQRLLLLTKLVNVLKVRL